MRQPVAPLCHPEPSEGSQPLAFGTPVLLGMLCVVLSAGCASVPLSSLPPAVEEAGSAGEITSASGTATLRFAAVSAVAVAPRIQPVHLPAMPRQQQVDPAGPGGPDPAVVDEFPDEFVIDGGDRGNPVHYQSHLRYGVETEDTIAEYTDDEGTSHILPSNRVAIYAPRFAAVRMVQLPVEGFGIERMAASHRLLREVRLTIREGPHLHKQQAGAVGARVRSRASGLLAEARTAGVSRLLRTGEHVKLINVFGDTGDLVAGRMDQAGVARLARSLENAAAWAGDEAPRATASTATGQSIQSTPWVNSFTGVEVKHKEIGELKLVKLADRDTALSDDVVLFTLRFDNVGERPLTQVRIIDNLSPRLEYIKDSATLGFTDEDEKTPAAEARGGRITVDDNEQGSEVLVFELDEPLPGGVGGVITFQARVR